MTNVLEERASGAIQSVITTDGDAAGGHFGEPVQSMFQATLNNLLDVRASQLCVAKRYERSADRVDTHAELYNRD